MRLELTLEIEKKIEERYADLRKQDQERIEALTQEVTTLQSKRPLQPGRSAPEVTQSSEREQALETTVNELEATVKSMRAKFKQHHEQTKSLKEEHASFKKMNPVETRKKLEEVRKKLKEHKDGNSLLMKKNNQQLLTIANQKRELEKLSALKEESADNFLYESGCGTYRVLGTVFQSENRPYVKAEVNYRILNLATGASYVAKSEEGQISFEELEAPADVLEYIAEALEEKA